MRRRAIALLSMVVLLPLGCNDDDGNDNFFPPPPPANVEGFWTGPSTNNDSATYHACSGAYVGWEGMTIFEVSQAAGPGPSCTTANSGIVTQSGSTYIQTAMFFTCDDGSSFTWSGGGTIYGDTLTGGNDTIHSAGVTIREDYRAIKTAVTKLSLDMFQFSVTGAWTGGCSIDPNQNFDLTIVVPEEESSSGRPLLPHHYLKPSAVP